MIDCDVIVVGGGPAGIGASLAASQLGADTMLIEKEEQLGGNVTGSFVHTICGLYRNDRSTAEHLHRGIPRHLSQYFRDRGVAGEPYDVGRVYVLPLYPEHFHPAVKKRLDQEKQLSSVLSNSVREVEYDGDRVVVRAGGDGNERTIVAGVVIDTTGRAEVAKQAGADVDTCDESRVQLPSYIVKLSGVRTEDTQGYGRLRLTRELAEAVKEEELPKGCESVLLRPGREEGTGYLTLNLPRDWNGRWAPLDSRSIKEWTDEARKRANHVVDYLRRNREGYEECDIEQFPAQLGIRESRTVRGKRRLNRDHLLQGTTGEDDVAVSGWPIELWQEYDGAKLEFPEGPAGIPLGSLVSRTHPRIGMAGRCLSATHEALGSLRVIGTSLATGQAVGTAGYWASQNDCTLAEVSPEQVRDLVNRELNG